MQTCGSGAAQQSNETFADIAALYNILETLESGYKDSLSKYPVRNEGHKSFCNIAVWLTLYMMQNAEEQGNTIAMVAQKSNKSEDEVRKAVAKLANDQTVIRLFKNYGTKNIKLEIEPSDYDILTQQLKSNHSILFSFIEDNEILQRKAPGSRGYMEIAMKKEVDFQWLSNNDDLQIAHDKFDGSNISYLSSKPKGDMDNTGFSYRLINRNKHWWVVVEKEVFEKNNESDKLDESEKGNRPYKPIARNTNKMGNVFMLTPLIPGATNAEIREIVHNTDSRELYLYAIEQENRLPENGRKFIEDNIEKFQESGVITACVSKSGSFITEVRFPNLENKFIGTKVEDDYSRTIFAPFSMINTRSPASGGGIIVKYDLRLKYNERGGQIKNTISILCCDGCPTMHNSHKLSLNQPYFFVMQTKQNRDLTATDVYPFSVCDPVRKTVTNVYNDKISLISDTDKQEACLPSSSLSDHDFAVISNSPENLAV